MIFNWPQVLGGIGERNFFYKWLVKINFSVRDPENSTGQPLLDARTLRFGYGKVNLDTHDPEWLDSSQFPRVSFSMESLSDFNWLGERMHANANGALTIKGKSIPISVPIKPTVHACRTQSIRREKWRHPLPHWRISPESRRVRHEYRKLTWTRSWIP